MQIVIVGAGRIGARVAQLARADGHDVIVFDKSRDRCEAISKRLDVVALNADATRERNLREGGVAEADGLIAATRADPVNLMVMTLGQRLHVPKRVSVLNNPASAPLFRALGAEMVGNPSMLAAEHLLHAARHRGIADYVTVAGDVELFKVDVESDCGMDGTALHEAGLPPGVIVAAVEREGRFILPRGETRIHAGDVVTLLARERLVDEVLPRFRAGGARGGV